MPHESQNHVPGHLIFSYCFENTDVALFLFLVMTDLHNGLKIERRAIPQRELTAAGGGQ